jgi:hypothetical protein
MLLTLPGRELFMMLIISLKVAAAHLIALTNL